LTVKTPQNIARVQEILARAKAITAYLRELSSELQLMQDKLEKLSSTAILALT
jgi:DNA anti-recombination protein RmuC